MSLTNTNRLILNYFVPYTNGKSIAGIADKLNIKLDIDRVLQYRSCYLQNKFNQI
jgi:hypothetical protein